MNSTQRERPHKSTTHEELYFHIREPYTDKKGKKYKAATVFARKYPSDDIGPAGWITTVVRCSDTDNFCRATGRNLARKRFFYGEDPNYFMQSETKPTYDDAKKLYMSI